MVTQIQLGNLYSANGRSVLGGSSTGLDTQSIITSLTDARRIPAVKLEDKIKINDSRIAALGELRTKLAALQDSANFLRNPPGVNNATDNIFQYRTSTITSNIGTASNYVAVTAEPGAAVQTYVIDNITKIAKAKKQETEIFAIANQDVAVVATSPTNNQFGAGTVTVNDVDIVFENGDTLREVAQKFNDVSASTGIAAQVFKTGDTAFKLIFTATQTGESYDFDFNNVDVVTINDPSNVFDEVSVSLTQQVSNAEFDIDGVTIERETNSIDDLVEGVTFNLLADTVAAPTTELTISVKPNTELVKNTITNFANAYNDFKLFHAKQTERGSNGLPKETAVLANNSALTSILNSVSVELSRIVEGLTDGDPNQLADVGLTFIDYPGDTENPAARNILSLDTDALQSALESNFSAVRKVFEFSFTANSSNLQVFSRTNALATTAFTLSINTVADPEEYEATYDEDGDPLTSDPVTIDLDGELVGNGVTLTGQAGTVLEGLVMIYATTGIASVDVEVSQGIGDRLYNVLDGALDDIDGTIQTEISALNDANTRYQEDIDDIDAQIEAYRDQLLTRFATLEATIARINNLLASLDAQAQARANG